HTFDAGGAALAGAARIVLAGLAEEALWGSVPRTVVCAFQMTFAIITPALVVGAFAERMKFSAMLLFSALWVTVVYAPAAHWVWAADGWLYEKGLRSEEHTSELSHVKISYAVFCL